MSEFKVGDRVRVLREGQDEGAGTVVGLTEYFTNVELDKRKIEWNTLIAHCYDYEVSQPAFHVGDRVEITGGCSKYIGRQGVVVDTENNAYGLEVVLDGDDPAALGYAFKPTEVVWLSAGNEVPQPEPTPEPCDCALCQPKTWVDDLTADDYDPWDDAPDDVCDCDDADEATCYCGDPDCTFKDVAGELAKQAEQEYGTLFVQNGVVASGDPVRSEALKRAVEHGGGCSSAWAVVEIAKAFESYLRGE